MPSVRMQRRIDALLDQAEIASDVGDWAAVAEKARAVLSIDDANEDAASFLKMAGANGASSNEAPRTPARGPAHPVPPLPASFVAGRYAVRRFLGEGGRKRVYLAHDSRLDREVAFCAIRTDGLDLVGHERVRREAQAMGRLGGHPNLVPIYDIGDDLGAPYIVEEFMAGGDVAALLETADEHRLPVDQTLAIAKDICRGLAFIHGGGLVHRDLKPANVFLAADGTAKIGDFGLAVALDRSRLTQHGLMLGTVAYMPPEQALGGESTPKADLYSLGAMLYEMVTGKPPFVGDDPTAVISQHINTPPVAPSWVTEHCPPAFEAVILQLLEKDPGRRPESASAVLATLGKVDPTERSATHSDSNALERLARGVFVGREKELERLRKAFDDAFAGHGGLVMLVGEPGIGKTRTAQELETYARIRGAQVLWGASHEASGAPPFYPFIQVGRQWGTAAANNLSTISSVHTRDGAELVRLFPELRDLVPDIPTAEAVGDAAAAQFRLFEAYTNFVRAISEQRPTVIALDDLHWADKPTLQLLQHLARGLSGMRVLVVCTYRDTDITRKSALSETLATLNREPGFERIVLRGLSKPDVRGYIAAAAHIAPSVQVSDRIFDETEGNPFFLAEVVNLLTQEGSLDRDSVSDIAVPDGVKEALGRRLDRISAEGNDLLQVAAVVGREFAYDTLTLLGDWPDDQLLQLIEEAIESRVIEETGQPGRYRFTHALMQETLLSELSTTRRVRLHGQVGEALEKRWGDRVDEFASRLALHFSEAATLSGDFAERARFYALAAADRAYSQSAWDEAIRWYEAALEGNDDPNPAVLAAMATAYECAQPASERSWSCFVRAMEGYSRREDNEGRLLALAAAPIFTLNDAGIGPYIAEALAVPNTLSPKMTLGLRMKLLRAISRSEAAGELGPSSPENDGEIQRLAEVVGGLDAVAAQQELNGYRYLQQVELGRAAQAFDAAAESLIALGASAEGMLNPLLAAPYCALTAGNLVLAHTSAERLRRVCSEARMQAGVAYGRTLLAAHATLRWQREALRELVAEGHADIRGWFWPADHHEWVAREYEGCHAEVMSLLGSTPLDEPPQYLVQDLGARVAMLHLDGSDIAAEKAFGEWLALWRLRAGELAQRVEAVGAVMFASSASWWTDESSLELYDTIRHWKNYAAYDSGVGLDPWRGHLALRLGLEADAERHFHEGLEWAQREDCPVELGRNLQGLAAIAEARGDVPRALALLDRAAAQYQPRGVKLFLDQVIAAKVRLQGIPSEEMRSSILAVSRAVESEHPDLRTQAAPDGTVTLLFSDIENSTPLNEQMGDAKWLELLREHNALIEGAVAAHHGFVVKTMGDGYMVAFKSAVEGLRCAIAIQQTMSARDNDVRVRIGLHTGEMTREGDDFFGRHVNLAARVAGHAAGGEVLVSGVVHELVAGQGFEFDDGGERTMKGFEDAVRVWAVRWRTEPLSAR